MKLETFHIDDAILSHIHIGTPKEFKSHKTGDSWSKYTLKVDRGTIRETGELVEDKFYSTGLAYPPYTYMPGVQDHLDFDAVSQSIDNHICEGKVIITVTTAENGNTYTNLKYVLIDKIGEPYEEPAAEAAPETNPFM